MTILHVHGAPFRNLGFDEAKTNDLIVAWPNQTGYGYVSNLLYGWEATSPNGNYISMGLDLYPPIDGSLLGPVSFLASITHSRGKGWPFLPEGKYELVISGFTSITQTGHVPSDAKYLTYRYTLGYFDVKLNGQLLQKLVPDMPIRTFANSSQYFDVSAFTGHEVQLEVVVGTSQTPTGEIRPAGGILDSIQFLPELPTTVHFVKMQQPRITREGLTLTWTAPPRTVFRVESAYTLTSPYWLSLGPISSSTEEYSFLDTRLVQGSADFVNFQQFYRLNVVSRTTGLNPTVESSATQAQ